MPDVLEIDAGSLRQRLAWQQAGPPPTGDDEPTYTAGPTVWGRVDPFRGDEQTVARQRVALTWYTVWVRYNDVRGLKGRDRFLWDGLILEVVAAYPKDGRTAYLECQCTCQA